MARQPVIPSFLSLFRAFYFFFSLQKVSLVTRCISRTLSNTIQATDTYEAFDSSVIPDVFLLLKLLISYLSKAASPHFVHIHKPQTLDCRNLNPQNPHLPTFIHSTMLCSVSELWFYSLQLRTTSYLKEAAQDILYN